jgi:hypothetical protein
MRRSDFSRAEYSPRRSITCPFQFSEDMEEYGCPCWVIPPVALELGADESFDVLEEYPSGLNSSDCFEDVGE